MAAGSRRSCSASSALARTTAATERAAARASTARGPYETRRSSRPARAGVASADDERRLELREPVRGVGGAATGGDGAAPRRRDDDVGGDGPPGRRHRRDVAGRRRGRAGQGRPVPLQRAGVHRVGVRRVQGRAGDRQHELPLRRRRARLPVGQRRRRGRRVPRRVHRAHRRAAPPPAADPHVAVGRRRPRPVPGLGDPLRDGRRHADRGPRRRAVGPLRRPPRPALHRRHDRACRRA